MVRLLFVSFVLGLVAPVHAQVPTCSGTDPERAARAIAAGDDAVAEASTRRGRHREDAARAAFERALASYEEACAAGTDRALERRAIPLARLGRPLEAIESVDAFLRDHPLASLSAEDRARIESNLHALERDVATLTVSAAPAAEVFLDGRSVGMAPIASLRALPREDVELRLRAPGHLDSVQRIDLLRGQTFRLEVRLEADPAAVTAAMNPDSVSVEPPRVAESALPPPPSSIPNAAPPADPAPVILTTASAIAFLAVGIVGMSWALERRLSLDGACFSFGAEAIEACAGTRTEHDVATGLAIGGFAAAAGFATAAIVLAYESDRPAEVATIACGLGPLSVGCRGRF